MYKYVTLSVLVSLAITVEKCLSFFSFACGKNIIHCENTEEFNVWIIYGPSFVNQEPQQKA